MNKRVHSLAGFAVFIVGCAAVSARAEKGLPKFPADEEHPSCGGHACPLPSASAAPTPAAPVSAAPSREEVVYAAVEANRKLSDMVKSMKLGASQKLENLMKGDADEDYVSAKRLHAAMLAMIDLRGRVPDPELGAQLTAELYGIRQGLLALRARDIKSGLSNWWHEGEREGRRRLEPHGNVAIADLALTAEQLNVRRAYLEFEREYLAVAGHILEIAKAETSDVPLEQDVEAVRQEIPRLKAEAVQDQKAFNEETSKLMKDASAGFQTQMQKIRARSVYDLPESR